MRFVGFGKTVALDSNGDRVESYEVMNYVQNTTLAGVGGTPVALEGGSEGDRIESYDIMSSVAVGLWNSSTGQYTAYQRSVVWPGRADQTPSDFVPPGEQPHAHVHKMYMGTYVSTGLLRTRMGTILTQDNIFLLRTSCDLH